MTAIEADLTRAGEEAERSSDWSGAITSWTSLMQVAPETIAGPIGLARSLIMAKRYGAADTLLASSLSRFPNDNRLLTLSAAVAMAAGRYEEAVRRWCTVLELNPAHPAAAARIDHCQQRLCEKSKHDPAKRQLFDAFTSLGRNCEFGLLQRDYGSENMGLFRYAQTRPDALIKALNSKFSGMGDVENMTVHLTKMSEYNVQDAASGIVFHTMEYRGDVSESAVLKKQGRRLRILRDILISEMKEGQQIFVYQNSILPEQTMTDIHDALSVYGPNILLCVRETQNGEVGGSTRLIRRNLMVGLVDHEGVRAEGVWDICKDQWEAICTKAYAQWRT